MVSPTATLAPAASPSLTLAEHVAALLPPRAGTAWTAEPHRAWWSTAPAARIVHGVRALVVVARAWDTEIGWQLPGRVPTRPDLRIARMAPAFIVREPALLSDVVSATLAGADIAMRKEPE
ncbi:hypothetical protein ACWIID_02290 [Streptomyces phaeochromogenes]